jgi:hypothetical protein
MDVSSSAPAPFNTSLWQSLQKKAVLAVDAECSFTPRINKRSKELKGRSVIDMSRGDMLRKENAQRLMRLKSEQAQLDGLTFQPEINPASREIEGRLRITSEGDTYLQRVQLDMKLFSDRQRKAAQEAEMQQCVVGFLAFMRAHGVCPAAHHPSLCACVHVCMFFFGAMHRCRCMSMSLLCLR